MTQLTNPLKVPAPKTPKYPMRSLETVLTQYTPYMPIIPFKGTQSLYNAYKTIVVSIFFSTIPIYRLYSYSSLHFLFHYPYIPPIQL